MRSLLLIGTCVLATSLSSPAAAQAEPEGDLSDLSIEELAQLPVRSASKRAEPLSSAPTALYVITGDDIESSGAVTLPEALRLAPNLQVQQVDSRQYSISARGFNGLQAGNKVLALIDGRSIYTPLASSVFWQLHWPMVEDLQQIEVISGPGGTLYGPNAVNGVINIATRDAQDTIGTLGRGTIGPEESSAALRHGFVLGSSGAARVYANWYRADGLPQGTGAATDDDFNGWQAGFRSDFATDQDHFTLQGDIFRTSIDTLAGDGAKGHNLLARWSRTLSPSSSLQLQAYYDRIERQFTLAEDFVETLDSEVQFNAAAGAHEIVAGAGARTTKDEFTNDLNIFNLNPTRRRLWVYNAFVQDHFNLSPALALIAGVKVERSSFTGWQVLPNLRMTWQPSEQTLLWGAVSRAVRTPSRIDRQLEALPVLVAAMDFDSEKLVAFEAGYRGQPSQNVSLSVSGFVNFYDDLRSTEDSNGGLPFKLDNGWAGRTYGIEAWGSAQLQSWWRLWLGASTLWKDLDLKDGHIDLVPRNSLGNDPNWQVMARSEFNLSPDFSLMVNGRLVDGLDRDPEIGSYAEAGANLAYRLNDSIELFATGRNLLHRVHFESNDPGEGQLARRSVMLGARARF